MKLVYIEKGRLPTEKAYGYQICKMCEEFSNLGIDVELMMPKNEINKETVFEFYGIKNNFKITIVNNINFIKYKYIFGKLTFYLNSLFFLLKLLFIKVESGTIIYTRIPEIVWLFNLRGHKVIFEAHGWPESKHGLYAYLLKRAKKIFCNSAGTERMFIKLGFRNTGLAPNGVDIDKFKIDKDEQQLRKELGVPLGKKVAMYVGHLYQWKGIVVMLESAKELEYENIIFFLIGGTDGDIDKYRKIVKNKDLKNVIIFGYQKKEKIPFFLKCADCLLLPNAPISKESIEFTSPIKMFEYMASGRPIVASDLKSIKEVLNNENSFLFEAGSSKDLTNKILDCINNEKRSFALAKRAYNDVQGFTWKKRAEKIKKELNLIYEERV